MSSEARSHTRQLRHARTLARRSRSHDDDDERRATTMRDAEREAMVEGVGVGAVRLPDRAGALSCSSRARVRPASRLSDAAALTHPRLAAAAQHTHTAHGTAQPASLSRDESSPPSFSASHSLTSAQRESTIPNPPYAVNSHRCLHLPALTPLGLFEYSQALFIESESPHPSRLQAPEDTSSRAARC